MKRSFLWVVLAAMLIVLGSAGSGCGGGGGGSSSNGNGNGDGSTGGTYTNVRVSATVNSFGVDTSNLAVGDQVQLRLLARNSQGQTVTLNGSNWTTNAPSSVATLTSGGLLTAVGPSGGTTYTITVAGPSGQVSAPLAVKAAGAFVTGHIRNINGTSIPSVKIRFYNSSKTLVGQAQTAANGTFRGNVPAGAKYFTLDIETADPGPNSVYYRQFEYTPPGKSSDLSYLMGETNCLASLPTLTEGSTFALPEITLDARVSGPPPPPTGCVGG